MVYMSPGKKGISPLVTSIFLLAITVAGMVLVLNIGNPAITKARENSLFTEAKQNLEILESTIDTVVYGGEGTSRKVTLSVTKGEYHVNESSDSIKFIYDMTTDLLPAGLCEKEGGLKIKTYGSGRVLDARFDEGTGNTTQDCSRYNNTGTLKPNETYGPNWTSDSKFGKALQFDGVDDYVDLGSEKSISTGSWTVNVWFKADSVSGTTSSTIDNFVADGDSGENNVDSYICIRGSKLAFWDHGVGTWRSSDTTLNNNQWYMGTFRYDNDGSVEFYLNGNSDGSGSLNTGYDDFAIRYIGVLDDGSSRFFNGTLDEVRIYDRALSESEVETLYQGGRVGNAQELEIALRPSSVNVTNSVRFGRGTNNIFLKNDGYVNGKTKLVVREV